MFLKHKIFKRFWTSLWNTVAWSSLWFKSIILLICETIVTLETGKWQCRLLSREKQNIFHFWGMDESIRVEESEIWVIVSHTQWVWGHLWLHLVFRLFSQFFLKVVYHIHLCGKHIEYHFFKKYICKIVYKTVNSVIALWLTHEIIFL